jgi:hypothetical protein
MATTLNGRSFAQFPLYCEMSTAQEQDDDSRLARARAAVNAAAAAVAAPALGEALRSALQDAFLAGVQWERRLRYPAVERLAAELEACWQLDELTYAQALYRESLIPTEQRQAQAAD